MQATALAGARLVERWPLVNQVDSLSWIWGGSEFLSTLNWGLLIGANPMEEKILDIFWQGYYWPCLLVVKTFFRYIGG